VDPAGAALDPLPGMQGQVDQPGGLALGHPGLQADVSDVSRRRRIGASRPPWQAGARQVPFP